MVLVTVVTVRLIVFWVRLLPKLNEVVVKLGEDGGKSTDRLDVAV